MSRHCWYEVDGGYIESFPTLDEVMEAMKAATLIEPPTVRIILSDGIRIPLEIVVNSIKVKIVREGLSNSIPLILPINRPDFQFNGWVKRSGFHPKADILWVRGVYVAIGDEDQDFDLELSASPSILAASAKRLAGIIRATTTAPG